MDKFVFDNFIVTSSICSKALRAAEASLMAGTFHLLTAASTQVYKFQHTLPDDLPCGDEQS